MSETSRGAESFVCRWLEGKGWDILARNFRTRRSEIDIIAMKDSVTAVIEVKYAGDDSGTMALEKIDTRKQSRILHAAAAFTSVNPPPGEVRFDVAIVRGSPDSFRMGSYIPDAFRPDMDWP